MRLRQNLLRCLSCGLISTKENDDDQECKACGETNYTHDYHFWGQSNKCLDCDNFKEAKKLRECYKIQRIGGCEIKEES